MLLLASAVLRQIHVIIEQTNLSGSGICAPLILRHKLEVYLYLNMNDTKMINLSWLKITRSLLNAIQKTSENLVEAPWIKVIGDLSSYNACLEELHAVLALSASQHLLYEKWLQFVRSNLQQWPHCQEQRPIWFMTQLWTKATDGIPTKNLVKETIWTPPSSSDSFWFKTSDSHRILHRATCSNIKHSNHLNIS